MVYPSQCRSSTFLAHVNWSESKRDGILPDSFLQRKDMTKVVWIFPPDHTVSSFGTIGLSDFVHGGSQNKRSGTAWIDSTDSIQQTPREFGLSNISIIDFLRSKNNIENRSEHIFRSGWIRTIKSDKMQNDRSLRKEENTFPAGIAEAVWCSLQMQIFHYRKEQIERSSRNSAFAKHEDNHQSEMIRFLPLRINWHILQRNKSVFADFHRSER